MDAAAWVVPIVVALIAGGFSYLGVSQTVKAQHNKTIVEMKLENEKQKILVQSEFASIKKDLERLEQKQDKHNAVIERTYKLEQQVADLEKRIN